MSSLPPKLTKNELVKKRKQLLAKLVHNELVSRASLLKSRLDPPNRDLNEECGYITNPRVEDYKALYDREGVASRVVNIYPDECWAVYPQLYEREDNSKTRFERAWERLNKRIPCWHYLHRVDRLSGIGSYGVLLIGLDDGKKLSEPASGVLPTGEPDATNPPGERKILYLRPFSEDLVRVQSSEADESNPRFGQPVLYDITINDPDRATDGSQSVTRTLTVHWTRVIHVADNRESSEVYGTPRMQAVLDRLCDLRKILGASAEMFWKGGFPGYSFEAFPELSGDAELDEDSIKDQIDDYMNGLKRYLALTGGALKSLAPQVADPSKHVEVQLMIIGATIGTPLRILLGSEAAHLASTQDSGTFNKRIGQRQTLYVDPYLIRPFVDRLILLGALPAVNDYTISWKDLNTMSDTDKANVSLKRAQALMQYVSGGCETIIPPTEFLIMVLGYTKEEADAITEAAAKTGGTMKTEKVWNQPKAAPNGSKPKTQGGGRRGNAPKTAPGRPAQRTPKA